MRLDKVAALVTSSTGQACKRSPAQSGCALAVIARARPSGVQRVTGTCKVPAQRISNTLEADVCPGALNEAIHTFCPPEIMNTEDGRARYLDDVFTARQANP